MLILLSPAKSLDFSPSAVTTFTEPELLDEADRLIATLRKKSKKKVAALMSLSDSLAELNVERYQSYERPFVLNGGAKQALLAFKGDVYREWPLDTYSDADFAFAQDHLRILSGLYGSLRPLDLIRPYRLEMGTQLKTRRGKNLYAFWGGRITEALNRTLDPSGDDLVINLASNEYFSAVKRARIQGHIVSPVFKDWKNGRYKIISFFAKRARGAMADHLIRNRVGDLAGLRAFDAGGYRYDPATSTEDAPVFLRKTT
jgi:cytoplasmic iron level regulating protein YaaA (DUF328/UPF0246 family)